jgi:ATP-dependent exoDNAse (exonuclease V) beta subunit
VKSAVRPLVAESDATDQPRDDAPTAIDTDAAPPLELGDAFHRVMELIDVPAAATLEPLARAICEEHGIPDSAEAVVAMARLTLKALDTIGIDVGRAHREVPFVVPDGDRVLIGRLDLVAGEDAGVDVVDFKTDERKNEPLNAAVEAHRGQLETYERAVSTVLPGRSTRLRVVFSRTGESRTFVKT